MSKPQTSPGERRVCATAQHRISFGRARIGPDLVPLLIVPLLASLVACHSSSTSSQGYEVKVDVTEWIHALGSDDLFESEPAIDGLVALGDAVIPVLQTAFEREDAATRRGIIEVLQQIDPTEAVPVLLKAVRDPDEEVRVEALEALATSGDDRAGPIIERALYDSSPAVSAAAVDACALACNSPAALQRIVEIALHDEPFVRMSVPRQTLHYILQEDAKRAQLARDAITSMALPLLTPSTDARVRLRAAILLADMQNDAAIPVLHEALVRPIDDVPPNVNAQMQIQAIAALGKIGREESVRALQNRAKRGGRLAPRACRALDQLARRGVEGAEAAARGCSDPRH